MYSDQDEIARGLRMAAIAVVSAIVTATVVIGAGEAWLSKPPASEPSRPSPLIVTSG